MSLSPEILWSIIDTWRDFGWSHLSDITRQATRHEQVIIIMQGKCVISEKNSMNSNSSYKHRSARTSCVWKFLLSPLSEIQFKTIISDHFCTTFIQFSHGQWAIQNYILHSLRNSAGWKTVYEVLSENESINEKSIRLMDSFLDTTSWTVCEPSKRIESSKWVSHFYLISLRHLHEVVNIRQKQLIQFPIMEARRITCGFSSGVTVSGMKGNLSILSGLNSQDYWWLIRVTFVVAFGFLPQNFGRWQGPTNHHFSQKWMQLE